MHIKIKLFAFLSFLLVSSILVAQTIDTISYVPVKHGYYDSVVTKSSGKFATTTGVSSMESLKVNSNTLNLFTGQVHFGKPVYVNHNVTAETGALLGATNATIGGQVITGGMVKLNKVNLNGNKKIRARDIDIPNRKITMPSSAPAIKVDGIDIIMPNCPMDESKGKRGAQWIEATGWDSADRFQTFQIYGCSGTIGEPKCLASQRDKDACNNSKNSWDDTNCCCSGNFITNFKDNAGMCGSNYSMCQGTKLVNQYLACSQYGSNSAHCICAKGDRASCLKAIYGTSADELNCSAGSSTWPCNCPDLVKINNYGFVNYACLFGNTPAKRCNLQCQFPMVKELTYSGKYECVCMDPNLFGSNNSYYAQCSSTYPSSNKFQGCCCGEYRTNSYDGSSSYFSAPNPNVYSYAYNFYYAAQNDQSLPSASCPSGYYDLPNGWGGTSSTYVSYAYPCTCGGGYW